MKCTNCKDDISEDQFRINCSDCGDFCDEFCYMQHHDKNHGCA